MNDTSASKRQCVKMKKDCWCNIGDCAGSRVPDPELRWIFSDWNVVNSTGNVEEKGLGNISGEDIGKTGQPGPIGLYENVLEKKAIQG
ncbi:MAG: hypothetical protein D3922_00295 [Candidatus Electrothrix sp. AR1]|nr:hypothetical protein [Candidatus Electrothrix sp. AR1]